MVLTVVYDNPVYGVVNVLNDLVVVDVRVVVVRSIQGVVVIFVPLEEKADNL